jgi:CheY-like chemotaxis protein
MARKAVILCVDDEELPLILRRLVLEKFGYEVVTASCAASALELLKSAKVDLVLSDHLMPNMTGAELAREIKSLRPDLPVVLLSGVNEIPTGADGADAFISKVEGPEGLCRELATLLELASIT